jgi:hypothetical protein
LLLIFLVCRDPRSEAGIYTIKKYQQVGRQQKMHIHLRHLAATTPHGESETLFRGVCGVFNAQQEMT